MSMNRVLKGAVVIAALVFIAVSALMNALFLSSLGRTGIEAGLLAAVSLASDTVKAVLPVLMVRAVNLRAWGHAAAAAVMLTVVVALSLASGTGFAALTRDGATATRESKAAMLMARKQELRDIESQMTALSPARPATVIDVELRGLQLDRRWMLTKSCQEPVSVSGRQFCAAVSKIQQELATARARDELVATRQRLINGIEELQRVGAGTESDPQVAALAELFGVDRILPRVIITSSIAVILELGSVILVLLVAGPTLRDWREPGEMQEPRPVSAETPLQSDRLHWRRQRDKAGLVQNSGA